MYFDIWFYYKFVVVVSGDDAKECSNFKTGLDQTFYSSLNNKSGNFSKDKAQSSVSAAATEPVYEGIDFYDGIKGILVNLFIFKIIKCMLFSQILRKLIMPGPHLIALMIAGKILVLHQIHGKRNLIMLVIKM